jgi:iron complex outermembrane recepter protein
VRWAASRLVGGMLAGLPVATVAQSQQSSDAAALEEVVITAQRREENLQKSAIAVSVITGDHLANAGVTRVQELTQLVPALQVGTAVGPYPLFYLRGVGNFNGNVLSDAAVAVNLDGVYIARPSSTSGMFYDIDRLEILKGPQGTLYGRNATGGAINVITRKPQITFGGDATVDTGNDGLLRVNGDLNLPLSERLAARAAFQLVQHDGYLTDGTDDDKSRAGRIQFRYSPSTALSILTSVDFYHLGGSGPGATLLNVPGPGFQAGDPRVGLTDPRVNAIFSRTLVFTAGDFLGPLLQKALTIPVPTRLFQDNDFWGASATLDWKSDAGALTVIPAYRHGSLDYQSITPAFLVDQNENDKQASLEARFASTENYTWNYLIGAFYLDERIVDAPTYDMQFNAAIGPTEPTTKSYAAFGSLRYSVTDAFRVTGGLRYTHDAKHIMGTASGRHVLCPGVFIPPPAGPQFCFGGVGQVVVPNPRIDLDTGNAWADTTWRAGLEWDTSAQSLLYVSVETGFKAGGFFGTHDAPTYQPEKLIAYTLGSKSRFLDSRFQLNTEVFYWKYRDQQISHIGLDSTGTVIFPTENIGQATMKGVELEAQLRPKANTLLAADVQYLDAVYDDFVYRLPNFGVPPSTSCPYTPAISPSPFIVNCGGKTPPQSPRWTLNLDVQQTFPLGSGSIVADAHTHYQTATLTGLEFSREEVQDSYWMTGLSLSYKAPQDRWRVAAYAENIEDKPVVQSTFPNPLATQLLAATLRPPRVYGVRMGVKF